MMMRKDPRFTLSGMLGALQSSLDILEMYLLPLLGFEPQIVQPVVSVPTMISRLPQF